MRKISQTSIINFTPKQMYQLVTDVNSYKEFMPYCSGAHIEKIDDNQIKAQLSFQHLGIKLSFTTLNQHKPYETIDMQLIDGPFKHLTGCWTFEALGEEGCKIALDIEFEVANSAHGMAVQKLFEFISSKLVNVFIKRAKDLH